MSHKNYWDLLHFHEKVLKNCYTCSEILRILPPPGSMLCQEWKSYAIPGSRGQEWPSKHATNIEKESGSASLTIFVIDCRYQISLWTKSFNFLGQGFPKRSFPKGLFDSWIFWFLILDIWIDSTYLNKARFQILVSTNNFDSLEQLSPKTILPVENRKKEDQHWILHIWVSLGTKSQLKMNILNFWTRFSTKRVFPF